MSFLSFMAGIPGLSKFNVKYAIEVFSKHIIKHTKHNVDKYNITINFATNFAEFLVFHPGPDVPTAYRNPHNTKFKGLYRNVPDNARLYDIEIKGAIETIKEILLTQLKDFKGECNIIILNVNRNLSEIPCTVYYTNEDGKKQKISHVLK